ncbi:MAG: hypothetical protein HY903_16525 [Deltaproteobacteria bacterium]|nr:hypothetical protein [Deltaproteobacteria bacterium]
MTRDQKLPGSGSPRRSTPDESRALQARVTCGGRGGEHGMALLVVVVIMAIILVGGLAAIAITSGELDSSRGFRARAVTQLCAEAALEQIRAAMPDEAAANLVRDGAITVGASSLSYQAGHYASGSAQVGVKAVSASGYDAAALYSGQNITNSLGPTAGTSPGGVKVVSATATCKGTGYPEREVQIVFRYGTPAADR